MKIQEEILRRLDTEYSCRLAKEMEQFKCNEVLGYRSAGSRAEFETGEFLAQEMRRIGLTQVQKDAVTVDGWEFKRAVLSYKAEDGTERKLELGAYQTTMVTDGFQEFSLVYAGKGTEADYDGLDVTGKLVLADINQRDEWWINYPVYQAHLKGAAALLAVQDGGYGEIDDGALNAQDIAGPEYAPAFSVSRKDARELKELLRKKGELPVRFYADTRVMRGCTTYNIEGRIEGIHKDRLVLLSAHYDSYFSGFQDDNTAIAMMLGIAKAFLESGYRPRNTIVFCAMAAEEWGVADSNFDWSTGAYEQVFTAHPEWAGTVIADLNFELPALAHGTRARIRSCYEYRKYLEEFLEELPALTRAYPEETTVTAPIETWSDDFSMAIAGLPSMVNDFTGGSFMDTHYHSQFDNDEFYDRQVYRLHHELFALLIEALDRTAVVPLDFSPVMKRAAEALDGELLSEAGISEAQPVSRGADDDTGKRKLEAETEAIPQESFCTPKQVREALKTQEECEREAYRQIRALNRRYSALLEAGEEEEAERLYEKQRPLEKALLKKFKTEQDTFVRIDWYGNVRYPHEILLGNLKLLSGAAENLENGDVSRALRKLYQVDNNAYAFMFDEDVYRHFTDYVYHQPRERLKWGYQRLMPHENLYHLVKELLKKEKEGASEYMGEAARLRAACEKQKALLGEVVCMLAKTAEDWNYDK